jgi:cysteine synthase A
LKKANPKVKIFAIEPEESPIITKGYSGLHKIQGIGEGFIPKIIEENRGIIDEVIRVRVKMRLKLLKNSQEITDF